MNFFGYGAGGFASTLMSYGIANAGGVVTRFELFHAPSARRKEMAGCSP